MRAALHAAGLALMLGAASVRIVFPLLGPHALALDPLHLHVVVGGTWEQRAEALIRHHHHAAASGSPIHHAAGPTTNHVTCKVTVLSLHAGHLTGASAQSLATGAVTGAGTSPVPGPDRGWRLHGLPMLPPDSLWPDPPAPPPRKT